MSTEAVGEPVGEEASTAWGLMLAGLCAVRLVLTSHAPSIFDAGIAAGLALLLLREALVGRGVDRRGVTLTAAALLVGGAGVATSMHPLLSWWALPGWLAPFLAFALVRTQPRATGRRVVVALSLAGTLHSVVAIHQHFIGFPQTLAAADELALDAATRATLLAGRPLGLSLSPDLAGGLSLMAALLGLHLLLTGGPTRLPANRRARWAERVIGAIALVTGGLALVLSRSAGTALALLVSGAVIVLFRWGPSWRSRQSTEPSVDEPSVDEPNVDEPNVDEPSVDEPTEDDRSAVGPSASWWPIVGGLGVAVAGAAFAFRGLSALGHSASERLINWSVGVELFLAQPLGVGLARFGPAYLEARGPDANVTAYAHNALVHVGVELGVLGLVLGLTVVVLTARAVLRLPHEERAARAVLIGAAAVFAVRALVDYDLQVGQVSTLAGVVLGLALPARRDQLRTGSARAGTVVLVGVTLVPLMGLVPREVLLKPFEPGAVYGQQNIGALLTYAEEHPGDPITTTVAARMLLLTLHRCRGDTCEPVERRLRFLMQPQLDAEVPADGMRVVAGQLALLRGDLVEAEAQARAALDDHRGAFPAWMLLIDTLNLAARPQAREVALQEAQRWLPRDAVEALRRRGPIDRDTPEPF